MPALTAILGILLALLGSRGCFALEPSSVSASTPLWIGLALVALGAVAFQPALRMHAMHVAAMVALGGFLLGGRAVFLWAARRGVSSLAALTQTLMMFLCGVFLALCINSFVSARRKRAKERAAVS